MANSSIEAQIKEYGIRRKGAKALLAQIDAEPYGKEGFWNSIGHALNYYKKYHPDLIQGTLEQVQEARQGLFNKFGSNKNKTMRRLVIYPPSFMKWVVMIAGLKGYNPELTTIDREFARKFPSFKVPDNI